MVAISQIGNYFIKFSTFSYLCLATFDGFPLKLPIEIVRDHEVGDPSECAKWEPKEEGV